MGDGEVQGQGKRGCEVPGVRLYYSEVYRTRRVVLLPRLTWQGLVRCAVVVCVCFCGREMEVPRTTLGRRTSASFREPAAQRARVAVDAGERATRGERGERPTTASCPRKVGKVLQ